LRREEADILRPPDGKLRQIAVRFTPDVEKNPTPLHAARTDREGGPYRWEPVPMGGRCGQLGTDEGRLAGELRTDERKGVVTVFW
jgi:hypothetical protein